MSTLSPRLVAVLSVLSFLLMAAFPRTAEAQATGNVTVTVRNDATGALVAGADVQLFVRDAAGNAVLVSKVTTGANGQAQFNALVIARRWDVRATSGALSDRKNRLVFVAGANAVTLRLQ